MHRAVGHVDGESGAAGAAAGGGGAVAAPPAALAHVTPTLPLSITLVAQPEVVGCRRAQLATGPFRPVAPAPVDLEVTNLSFESGF